MVILKTGVKLSGLQPQIVLAIIVAEGIWGGEPLTITSVSDGLHSHTSLHYSGNGVDFRTRDIEDPAGKTARLKAALGVDFDVILESDHVHLEYQPRRA